MRILTYLLALVLSLAAVDATAAPTTNATAGIGVALAVEGQNIVIKQILPNSPAAAQSDIHVGDRILAVAQGEEPAVQLDSGKLAQAVAMIRGAKGTTVRLTIVPAGEDDSRAQVVSIVRGELKVLSQMPEMERKHRAVRPERNHTLRNWLMGGVAVVVLAGLGLFFLFRRKSG